MKFRLTRMQFDRVVDKLKFAKQDKLDAIRKEFDKTMPPMAPKNYELIEDLILGKRKLRKGSRLEKILVQIGTESSYYQFNALAQHIECPEEDAVTAHVDQREKVLANARKQLDKIIDSTTDRLIFTDDFDELNKLLEQAMKAIKDA